MKQQRTIYFNDARHYYLFVFEPPMTIEDATRPIDECSGTSVDTFIYGVARADGLFYDSKVGMQFKHGEHGPNSPGFKQAAYWRLWNNLQSLMDKGIDPLSVLIDKAHAQNMEFFASLRLGSYGGIKPEFLLENGGGGFLHEEVRSHQSKVLKELADDYETDGLELDFAAPPGGDSYLLPENHRYKDKGIITDWVSEISSMVKHRNKPKILGARIYPTEKLNLSAGIDVKKMISEGLLDYVTPMIYAYNVLDSNMPIEWLIDLTKNSSTSVYPMLQPRYHDNENELYQLEYATPEMMYGAASNFYDKGADGLYTHSLQWPLSTIETSILSDIGNKSVLKEKNKHYFINRSTDILSKVDYKTNLPITIPIEKAGISYPIEFYIADDIENLNDRITHITLKVRINDLVSSDQINFNLNGKSIINETCKRSYGDAKPYNLMWLEFTLEKIRPCKGKNILEFILVERAKDLISPLRIEDAEIIIEYGSYPTTSG